jgi:hypothetical protein
MLNFEEAAAWTMDEVQSKVASVLPEGWFAENDRVELIFTCRIKDAAGVIRWEEGHPDQRLLLLSAFGWLALRKMTPANPSWARRGNLTPELVRQHATFRSSDAPDPSDLSPDEINEFLTNRK